ncbi:hypothetical protein V2J09_015754 [Rumex salicifolius]
MQMHNNLHLDHLQTPSFPLLPIPLLLSSSSSSSDDPLPSCYSSASASVSDSGYDLGIGFSRQLDTFPVGDALCRFLSSVLPQPIEVRSGDSPVDALGLDVGTANLRVQVSEEKGNNATGARDVKRIEIVQFEVPELGQFLEGAYELERKGAEILSKVSVCNDKLEMGYIEENEPHLHEVQRSVYSVEDVPPISSTDVKIIISEDNDLPLGKNHFSDAKFPQLELEEITKGTFSVTSMENELQLFIASKEGIYTGNYDEVNWQELFCSMEIEQISDQISSQLLLEPLAAHQDLFLETGLECLTELSCTEEETGSHFTMFFTDSDFLAELLPFEEFKMLDPDYADISNALAIPLIYPALEKCENLSLKDMNFKSFDELVVFPEISIVDHNFKSFPVPILPDDEKVQSLYATITVVLDVLKSIPVSASDEIYLDWDLLGKDKDNCDIHATFRRMFSDVGVLKLGYDIQSTENSALLLDFILSDEIWIEIATENKMNMPSGGNTTVSNPPSAVLTDKILDDYHSRAEGGGKKIGDDSVSVRAESVTQLNELEFFVNPTKAIISMQSHVRSEKLDAESIIAASTSPDRDILSLCTRIQMDKWDIELHVDLDGAAKALCTGVNIPMSSMNLEELLNFVPMVENCKSMSMDIIGQKLDSCMPLPVDSMPLISKSSCPDLSSCPHTTVIVNTQNFDTEMIISRRSTYQKILALEKGGAQILERDFCLPVDAIISAGTCLAWYNCENIGKKATALDEAASSVPLCVDNIAANVLTTLSFTFATCIMVITSTFIVSLQLVTSRAG